jgi:hypothetical protein
MTTLDGVVLHAELREDRRARFLEERPRLGELALLTVDRRDVNLHYGHLVVGRVLTLRYQFFSRAYREARERLLY